MRDFEKIEKAISYISENLESRPGLEEVAAHLHMSPFHFQRVFRRWAGVTPKRFLQVITVERAKELLKTSKPLLEVAGTLGLGSASRLYDHFVNLEAATPGEFKTGGLGLEIEYSEHETPFGRAFIAKTQRGICSLQFLNEDSGNPLVELKKKWPNAAFRKKSQAEFVKKIFAGESDFPIPVHVSGTNFQVSVWRALLEIPSGSLTSYSRLATALGKPRSSRAVGRAVGSNPVAFLIPCHRVIRESGAIGGYHWGEARKQAIQAWESAKCEGKKNREA